MFGKLSCLTIFHVFTFNINRISITSCLIRLIFRRNTCSTMFCKPLVKEDIVPVCLQTERKNCHVHLVCVYRMCIQVLYSFLSVN